MRSQRQKHPSPLARILKEYRAKYGLKQEQLAIELSVEARTLRRYENEETILTDVNELRRIAGILGIEPERLGILPDLSTPDEIDKAIDQTWQILRLARFYQASLIVDRLLQSALDLTKASPADNETLSRLAQAQYLAAYVKNHTTHTNQLHIPLQHYHALEETARTLQDETLVNIALTYQGDMLQRGSDIEKGITYLEAARDTTPFADLSARGNALQLLARAYFRAGRLAEFDRAMHEAEDIASQIASHSGYVTLSSKASSTRGLFNDATVYEEWGKSLGVLGKRNDAMAYLDKAEDSFNKNWTPQRKDLLIKSARAMALIYSGEIEEGTKLSIECIDLCKRYGNVRTMERIYGINRHLDKLSRQTGNASAAIREALDGPIEF